MFDFEIKLVECCVSCTGLVPEDKLQIQTCLLSAVVVPVLYPNTNFEEQKVPKTKAPKKSPKNMT